MSEATPLTRSLFQLSVIVAVIALLAAVLLNSLNYVQEKAERTMVEATVLNMEKGLEIEVRTREIRGQTASIPDLVGANPVGGAVRFGICALKQALSCARRESGTCVGAWARLRKEKEHRLWWGESGCFPLRLSYGTDGRLLLH